MPNLWSCSPDVQPASGCLEAVLCDSSTRIYTERVLTGTGPDDFEDRWVSPPCDRPRYTGEVVVTTCNSSKSNQLWTFTGASSHGVEVGLGLGSGLGFTGASSHGVGLGLGSGLGLGLHRCQFTWGRSSLSPRADVGKMPYLLYSSTVLLGLC